MMILWLSTMGQELWPTKWYTFTEMCYYETPHLVDIYSVSLSGLREYQQLETYHNNETFYANSTRSAGKNSGVLLSNGTTFHYNITTSSGNLTTSDGSLLVFTSNVFYREYIDGQIPFRS